MNWQSTFFSSLNVSKILMSPVAFVFSDIWFVRLGWPAADHPLGPATECGRSRHLPDDRPSHRGHIQCCHRKHPTTSARRAWPVDRNQPAVPDDSCNGDVQLRVHVARGDSAQRDRLLRVGDANMADDSCGGVSQPFVHRHHCGSC